MAPKRSNFARKLLKSVENPLTVTKKPLKPVEDPPTVKRRLLLLEDDTPTKKKSQQLLENTLVESSDEEMATEEEEEQKFDSSSLTAPVKNPGKNLSTPCAPACVTVSSTEQTKKEYFQRKWSGDDEIVLLQGMIDFNNDEGKSVYEDMPSFFLKVKDKISFAVETIRQVRTKIRRLKQKWMAKRVKGVDEESLTNAHARKFFELANVIWRSYTVDDAFIKMEDKKLPSDSDWFANSFLVGALTSLGCDEYVVKKRWNHVPVETKKKIEEKLNLLRANEFQFILEKTSVLQKALAMLAKAN